MTPSVKGSTCPIRWCAPVGLTRGRRYDWDTFRPRAEKVISRDVKACTVRSAFTEHQDKPKGWERNDNTPCNEPWASGCFTKAIPARRTQAADHTEKAIPTSSRPSADPPESPKQAVRLSGPTLLARIWLVQHAFLSHHSRNTTREWETEETCVQA